MEVLVEVFDASSAVGVVRVVTLDRAERFALSAPGVDDPYVVSTVTVFGETPSERPYFTVAGDRLKTLAVNDPHARRSPVEVSAAQFEALELAGFEAGDPYGEVDYLFRDAGVLPPHVRGVVEDLVPVVDTPDQVRNRRVLVPQSRPTAAGAEHWPGSDRVLRQVQRRGEHELGEFRSPRHPDVAAVVPIVRAPVSPVSPYRGRA